MSPRLLLCIAVGCCTHVSILRSDDVCVWWSVVIAALLTILLHIYYCCCSSVRPRLSLVYWFLRVLSATCTVVYTCIYTMAFFKSCKACVEDQKFLQSPTEVGLFHTGPTQLDCCLCVFLIQSQMDLRVRL
jgi:hypothetical protein